MDRVRILIEMAINIIFYCVYLMSKSPYMKLFLDVIDSSREKSMYSTVSLQ